MPKVVAGRFVEPGWKLSGWRRPGRNTVCQPSVTAACPIVTSAPLRLISESVFSLDIQVVISTTHPCGTSQ